MPVTIDGTTGVTTPGATVGAITGILKATSGVVSQAVAGTDYLTSTSGGSITLATAQTASGTAVDFTSIPSWVKRITVMLRGVSGSGSSNFLLQLGTSSGIVASGYIGSVNREVNYLGFSTGFQLMINTAAPSTNEILISLANISANTWIGSFITTRNPEKLVSYGVGSIVLSSTLDRIRITTTSGTDTFDAGTINISYE
jgi:hypothetical protein